ncbi:glycoside hydrolase family 15 protein [Natrononativus amylolyticus]|uniref:glycoside hydrolase family 15 protein n=1 Tax=Natrononativus amylolyticus TaxID=2963434 RepID=UPI0020CE8DF2|nr:glycoside hydrolase family 15 protein [Natrononativus amylolyticus]
MGFQPLASYGLIGNDDRCALIGDGSIDWCCFPHVAAASVFARLLDERGGHFAVQPTDAFDSRQRYLDRTNVLQTVFETDSGRATLTDFMPVTGADDEPAAGQRSLYRKLRCDSGTLTLEADFRPRFDYARAETRLERDRGEDALVARGGDESLSLQIHGPLELRTLDGRAVGTATLEAGDTVWLALQYDRLEPTSAETCDRLLDETVDYWRDWVGTVEEAATAIADDEPWREDVIRSGLVLKLLINEGTGGIYAAPTTSLPEEYGGSRNWDYRYNWMRDAKFTVQALHNLGRAREATDYFEWFREISHDDPGEIQPVYGVHGETGLEEFELEHLSGYRHSSPVRIGNAATEQRQLDVYGAIVQGIYETLRHDEELTDEDWASIRELVDHVCAVWDERDAGIWEFREDQRHYVHSKLLCWVAVDRGIDLAEDADREAPLERWREERDAIKAEILERGYSESLGSFVQHFDADEAMDATCLLIPIYEFLSPEDPRVQSTIDTVCDRLLTDNGLVYRVRDSDVADDEPTGFVLCSFWLVDALVLCGRVEEAREIFTNLLEHTTPLGLLAERVDPATGELFGNFPQAFSHIGLINSAIYLGLAADRDLEHDPLGEGSSAIDPLFRKDDA